MTKQATHKGTCQCCGREQMLPGGVLSKHGYTVEFGYFSGVCKGAGELPFELSKALVEKFISGAAAYAKSLREQAAQEMTSTASECMVHHYFRGGWSRYDKGGYRWIKVELTEDERGYTASYEAEGKQQSSIGYNTKKYHELYARHLSNQAEKAEQYCAWQRERIKGWKPRPEKLVPVKEERKVPLVHLAGSHWGYGNACAGSAMAAQRCRYTSKKASEVTCPKCLAIIERRKAG